MNHTTIHVAGNLFVNQATPLPSDLVPGSIELIASPILASNPDPAGPIKVLADGTHLPAGSDRTDHVAVLFPETGWMIHPVTLSDNGDSFDNHAAATKACEALRVLGFDDWQLAPREVWERHVLDLTRHDPAVDPNLYPGIQIGWHHTSTECAWSKDKSTGVASSAWGVGSDFGNVYNPHRDYDGVALAARRASQ